MTRRLPLLLPLLLSLTLAACGRNDAPDIPLYTIDQSTPAAAPDPALEGRWETVLDTSVDPRPFTLMVDLSGPAADVRMTSPSQGGAVIAFEQVRLDGSRIAFATPLGALRFEGALDGEDRIAGEVVQGGLVSPLSFTRAQVSGQEAGEPPR
ncbi:hypothetical protein ACWCOP_01785 [Maricaulaceae bacterium MS644]